MFIKGQLISPVYSIVFFSIFLTKLIFQVTSKTMILGWGQLETLKQDRLSLDCGIFVNVMMYE